MATNKVIGIDLGTTNSCVAVMEGGEAVVIPNAEGGRTTPSVVGISKNGERLVGQIAKRQAVANPDRTVVSIKRRMGTDFQVKIDDKSYKPQEISAMILQKLKTDAEGYLGEKITQAVITVPAYFTDAQRQATKDAGIIAGLEVLRIINEPTAAALSYGLDKGEDHTILVFDLGGGTFDVSILELGEGVFQVKATSGNNRLGGDDFDERVMNWLAENFKRENGIDLRNDRLALQRLKEAAEKAKVELSGVTTSNISLPFITAVNGEPRHLDATLTRAKFDELTADLVEATVGPTKRALADAGLEPKDIDKVIMVGGSARTPAVQDMVRKVLGKEPFKGVNPDEVVALGAAIQAGVLVGDVKNIVLLDVTPLSLGVETLGGVFDRIIDRNTTIPSAKKKTYSTAADSQTSVEIHVLQGERPMAADNITLGRFHLDGSPPAPRGIPQIEVTFDIDANGIVHVSAKDLGTGKEQKITITSSHLKDNEIERMMKEAEGHAEEDRQRREMADLRNECDAMVYSAEKTVKDLGEKADQSTIGKVNAAKDELTGAIASGNAEEMRAKKDALEKAIHELSAAVYQHAAQAGQATPDGADGAESHEGAGGGGPTVDADYHVVDDEEKK